MKRTFYVVLIAATLTGSAPGTAVAQQAPAAPPQPAPQVDVVPFNQRSAQDVRNELNQLLRDYPPSVGQVLRLDPSLLTREGYLKPYPALAAFIAQHPEIALQPAYYLGQQNFGQFDNDEPVAARVMRGFVDMASYVTALGGFIAFFLLVGWLARLVVDHRRWLRASKTQTDVHAKLFDRLTSNEDLLAYIQTPAGQHFLQSAPVSIEAGPRAIGAPVGRILWSVQAGVILAVVGLGLWLARNNVMDELSSPMYVIAILVIALGTGFALSAGVAYLLSLRLGLLEPPKP
jgi:hypothetical protein